MKKIALLLLCSISLGIFIPSTNVKANENNFNKTENTIFEQENVSDIVGDVFNDSDAKSFDMQNGYKVILPKNNYMR